MEKWDFPTRQLELPRQSSRAHLVSTIKGDMDARPDAPPSGAGTFGESVAGAHLCLLDPTLRNVYITVPRTGDVGEVTIQKQATIVTEKGSWVDDVAEVMRRVSERMACQLMLADRLPDDMGEHPCELAGPYPEAHPEFTWQLMTRTNDTGELAWAYVLDVSDLSLATRTNVSVDMGLWPRDDEPTARGQKLLDHGESYTACFLEYAHGQHVKQPALAVHFRGYRQMGREPTCKQVHTAVAMCNLATRKRHITSYIAFREGYKLNQASFIPVLGRPEYADNPRIRGRLASSAIVKLNVDAEQFCPAMLYEMYVLVIDAICGHVARDDGPPQLKDFLALWPEADVRIIANAVSKPVDAEDPKARAKAALAAAEKTIELIMKAEQNGRPVWAEAMIQHGRQQAQECKPVLADVTATFDALFPVLPARDRTPVFLNAVKAVINQQAQPPTFDYSIENQPYQPYHLSCQIRTHECLNKLMLLVYGMRCLGAHGSAELTLGGQGALSPGLTAFTFADVGDDAVASHLNAMLDEMRRKKHKFSPTMAAVSNVHGIYGRFAQIITEAVGHVVLDNFPDIKCYGTGGSQAAGDMGAFGLYRYRPPAPANAAAAAADSEDEDGAGYDVFA